MEKPLYPLKNMRITQGYGEGTHIDSFAIDDAGKDTGIENVFAPFTGTIKKIYQNDANEVWLESIDKVEYSDGTIDYMTMMFAHSNNVSHLKVGQIINKGTPFYSEGTKGNATGNHCHFECGRGKFEGSGWHKNSKGYWIINNSKNPQECLWIDETITIINNNNYNFKKIETEVIASPKEDNQDNNKDANKNNPENSSTTIQDKEPKLIFTCQKDDIYAIRLKKNQKLFIK
ncbi:MAG: hypothetical protein J6B89_00840 [Bacilli bacterium]|nr:hypothetical protein [Bacilli bacterium]